MTMSNPTLSSVNVPGSAPPNNRFSVDVTVQQGGPDPWGSKGSCTSENLAVEAWRTPVAVMVDGETVAEEELCLKSGNSKSTSLSLSVPEGQHSIKVVVYAVGGASAYNPLEPMEKEVNDDVTSTIEATADAPDPSRQTPGESVTAWIRSLADSLGGSSQKVALGMLVAVALFLVV